MFNSIKINEILKNKFNKRNSRLVHQKLQNIIERNTDLNNWEDLPCVSVGRLHIVKIAALPTVIYKFS